MRNKLLAAIISLFSVALLFGTCYSTWTLADAASNNKSASIEILDWAFCDGPDFISLSTVSNCSYLTASTETSIVSPRNESIEAVKFINTAGTQTKSHSFNIMFDRDYILDEIKDKKIEFDYYHAQKRQQKGKGLPKVQLLYNNSGKGNTQGGGEAVNDKSPFLLTNIDENWWHIEYFITALCPTMTDHGDTGIPLSQKINGVKVTDDAIYDFNSTTAFIVVDNAKFCSVPSARLGLFNRTNTFAVNGYYWMKVCWSGELNSCVITSSDETVAIHDTDSTKSPFYIKCLKVGTVTITATLTINSTQILSISNTITVT